MKTFRNTKAAGALLFFGGAVFWLVNTISEAVSPGYSVRFDAISRLGITGSPTQILWNSMMLVLGASWLLGAYFLFRGTKQIGWLIINLLPAIGVLLIGVFPEGTVLIIHVVGAEMMFLFGGIAAIADFKIIQSGFKYCSFMLGFITLASLFLAQLNVPIFNNSLYGLLGSGGAERIIVYPLMIWLMAFGGYLMGRNNP